MTSHLFEIDFRNADIAAEIAKIPAHLRVTALLKESIGIGVELPPMAPKLWSSLHKYKPHMLDWVTAPDLAEKLAMSRNCVNVAVMRLLARNIVEAKPTNRKADNGKFLTAYRWRS